jgi:hypothetical protein
VYVSDRHQNKYKYSRSSQAGAECQQVVGDANTAKQSPRTHSEFIRVLLSHFLGSSEALLGLETAVISC